MRESIEYGVRGIKFIRRIIESSMIDSRNEKVTRIIEYRKDPLLDRWSRVSKARALRPKPTMMPKADFPKILHQLSIDTCPLCPEKIFKVTTNFLPQLHVGDKIVNDRCVMFPNYYPFAPYHLVGALPEHHSILLKDIPIKSFYACILASIEFFKKINTIDRSAKYAHINCNYMPPAAASIIHPHIQVILDYQPTNYLRSILDASRNYYREYASNFWEDLLRSEIALEQRFISDGEAVTWVASFAPIANYEVIGILREDKYDLSELSENMVYGLARDIASMIRLMQNKLGLTSLNFSIYSGPIGERSEFFRIHVRIIGRSNIEPFYVNDRGFMEVLHFEPVLSTIPEDLAYILK